MNVLIDTTVANYWESSSNEIQKAVLQSFEGEVIKSRACWETINEIVSVAGTKKDNRLPARARLLKAITRFSPYLLFGEIVQIELQGSNDFFWPPNQHEKFRIVLDALAKYGARSKSLLDLHNHLRKEKQNHLNSYKDIQEPLRQALIGQPSPAKHMSFDDYNKFYWDQWSSSIDGFFKTNSNATRFSDAIAKPDKFPFTVAFARTLTALLYRYLAQNRKVKEGDLYDASRLVYLAGEDVLVTDDKGLFELSELVWGEKRKVIGFDDLVSRYV